MIMAGSCRRGATPSVSRLDGRSTCALAQVMRYSSGMEATISPSDTMRTRAAEIARALADPKRLCVVEQLSAGERSVSDLSRCIGCQVPNMSQHLAVLRGAGIVASRRDGSTVFYRLTERSVLDAYRLLQQIAR